MLPNPPRGAPEGTVWFGGPVDKYRITLRISGGDLAPDHISALLGCAPTRAERAGVPVTNSSGHTRIPKRGRWSLHLDSQNAGGEADIEDAIEALLARLTSDLTVWSSLTSRYGVDLFCGLFLATLNQGFSLSSGISRLLAERGIDIGFDIYGPEPDQTGSSYESS